MGEIVTTGRKIRVINKRNLKQYIIHNIQCCVLEDGMRIFVLITQGLSTADIDWTQCTHLSDIELGRYWRL